MPKAHTPQDTTVQIAVRLPEQLRSDLADLAAADLRSVNSLVVMALADYVDACRRKRKRRTLENYIPH